MPLLLTGMLMGARQGSSGHQRTRSSVSVILRKTSCPQAFNAKRPRCLLRSVLRGLEQLSDRLHGAAGRLLYGERLKGRYLGDEDTPISVPTPVR